MRRSRTSRTSSASKTPLSRVGSGYNHFRVHFSQSTIELKSAKSLGGGVNMGGTPRISRGAEGFNEIVLLRNASKELLEVIEQLTYYGIEF